MIGLKGSLHTTIFSKYTGLLQLKNIFRIFWSYFWNILEINAFQNKNQNLCKKRSCFLKMADTDNNKLMGLLIIAGGSLLLSQVCTKERRKQRKWMRIWIRKRDSIGAYCSCYSIINDLSLTDKKDFRKYLRMNTLAAIPILLFYLHKNQKYVFLLFLYCSSGHYQKFFTTVSVFTSWNIENERTEHKIIFV